MEFSVEDYCQLLTRSRLMSAAEVQTLLEWWRRNGRTLTENAEPFAAWLIDQQYLTKFQAERLSRGRVDRFFLNEFRLLDRISQGRMAGVFLGAHGPRDIVAIKVMPPNQVNDPQWFGRFKREAELAQRLDHPNCVRTYKTDRAEGLHYLVMEYLDGETLEEVLQRRKRLPIPEAVRLLDQALSGLEHIDEQGMVHRDLKPANLMLVPAPQPGRADTTLACTLKILDIGLGRDVFDELGGEDDGNRLTMQGDVLGVPDYMAPEQAADAHNVDIRADIYSLGCVLYEALSGQVPFPGGNAAMKIVRHMSESPQPLPALVPGIPLELDAIVARMLAKQPAQRFATPRLAAQALAAFLQGAETPATSRLRPTGGGALRESPALPGEHAGVDLAVELEPVEQPTSAPAPVAAAARAAPKVSGLPVPPALATPGIQAAGRPTVAAVPLAGAAGSATVPVPGDTVVPARAVTQPAVPIVTEMPSVGRGGRRGGMGQLLSSSNPLVLVMLGAGFALLFALLLLGLAWLVGLIPSGKAKPRRAPDSAAASHSLPERVLPATVAHVCGQSRSAHGRWRQDAKWSVFDQRTCLTADPACGHRSPPGDHALNC